MVHRKSCTWIYPTGWSSCASQPTGTGSYHPTTNWAMVNSVEFFLVFFGFDFKTVWDGYSSAPFDKGSVWFMWEGYLSFIEYFPVWWKDGKSQRACLIFGALIVEDDQRHAFLPLWGSGYIHPNLTWKAAALSRKGLMRMTWSVETLIGLVFD